MADLRYLTQRHDTWFFIIAVPRGLRSHPAFLSSTGKPRSHVVETLRTQSRTEAQTLRAAKLAHWQEAFTLAAKGVAISLDKIEALAEDCYTTLLERMEAQAKRQKMLPRAESENIQDELGELVDEILVAQDDPDDRDVEEAIDTLPDFALVAHELAAAQRRAAVHLEPDSTEYATLGRALVRATLAALEDRLHLLRQEPFTRPASFLGRQGLDHRTGQRRTARAQPVAQPTGGIRFSEAWAGYLEEAQRDAAVALNKHTVEHNTSIYRLFQRHIDDAPLAAIDKAMASDFLDLVGRLSPRWNWIPGAQDMPLRSLADACKGNRTLSNKTLNRYSSALSAVWKWADSRGRYEGRNPFAGQWRKVKKGEGGWRRFDVPELNKLFSAPLLVETTARDRIRPARYDFQNAMMWIPLVALFSGMRSGEICQLQRTDVQQRGGIWFFNVDDEGPHQHLKSIAAKRIVPVHSELTKCGFLEYWKRVPEGQLWPALKPGGADGKLNHYFAKRFVAYKQQCGITGQHKVFHSFRKNVAQAMKDARCTPAEIAEVVGHEQGFTLATYAPLGLPIAALRELIERVKYPGLKLDHLHV